MMLPQGPDRCPRGWASSGRVWCGRGSSCVPGEKGSVIVLSSFSSPLCLQAVSGVGVDEDISKCVNRCVYIKVCKHTHMHSISWSLFSPRSTSLPPLSEGPSRCDRRTSCWPPCRSSRSACHRRPRGISDIGVRSSQYCQCFS